jgi:hypothetical protein
VRGSPAAPAPTATASNSGAISSSSSSSSPAQQQQQQAAVRAYHWSPEKRACSVFFARVPPSVGSEEVEAVFATAGRVAEVQLYRTFVKCRVSKVRRLGGGGGGVGLCALWTHDEGGCL